MSVREIEPGRVREKERRKDKILIEPKSVREIEAYEEKVTARAKEKHAASGWGERG